MPVPTGRTVVLASIAMICGLQNAAAAEYPERPVTVIVPYAAGGAGDTIIRSDNGPEFVAKAVQDWITAVGARTAYPPYVGCTASANSTASLSAN